VTTPRRIQLRRSKGWRLPSGAIVVARPGIFGNPFKVGPDMPLKMALRCYREWLVDGETYLDDGLSERRARVLARLPELRGKDLACWCPLPKEGEPDRCHAAVLMEYVNR
jgi:hypothetical protein